jgi:hypothetical protein
MRTAKLLSGWYRISGQHYFSNVRLTAKRGTLGCWSADLRVRSSGDLRQYAGLWDTKREAIEEAARLIERHDAVFVEDGLN